MRLLAELLTLTWNVHRDKRKHPAEFTVRDFLPDPFAPPVAEQRAIASGVMNAFEKNYQQSKKKPD